MQAYTQSIFLINQDEIKDAPHLNSLAYEAPITGTCISASSFVDMYNNAQLHQKQNNLHDLGSSKKIEYATLGGRPFWEDMALYNRAPNEFDFVKMADISQAATAIPSYNPNTGETTYNNTPDLVTGLDNSTTVIGYAPITDNGINGITQSGNVSITGLDLFQNQFIDIGLNYSIKTTNDDKQRIKDAFSMFGGNDVKKKKKF